MFFWILGIIGVFAVGLDYGVFNSQKKRIAGCVESLRTQLWQRHARIPLLLSLCEPLKASQAELFAQILAIRNTLGDEHMNMSSRMQYEKRLSDVLHQLYTQAATVEATAHDYAVKTLISEIQTIETQSNAAVREYNYQVDRFTSMLRFPWFSVWTIFGKKGDFGAFEMV